MKKAWQDHCIPIGNDHRCLPCKLSRKEPYKQQYRRKHVLKGWTPFLDESKQPADFQILLETKIGEQNTYTFAVAENFLISTAVATGTCSRQNIGFKPSERLRLLLQRRKQIYDNAIRKSLTFQIRRLHRKECRQWKVLLLRKHLAHPAHWKELQSMSWYTSKPLHQHPPMDGFVTMLETLSAGTPETPLQPNDCSNPWEQLRN